MISFIYGIQKHDTNDLIYKTKIDHRLRKQSYGYYQRGMGEG